MRPLSTEEVGKCSSVYPGGKENWFENTSHICKESQKGKGQSVIKNSTPFISTADHLILTDNRYFILYPFFIEKKTGTQEQLLQRPQ